MRKLEPVKITTACDVPPLMAKHFQQDCLANKALPEEVMLLSPLKAVLSAFSAVFTLVEGSILSSKPVIQSTIEGLFNQGKIALCFFGSQISLNTVKKGHAKAGKSDAAQTDTSLWNLNICDNFQS